MPKKFQLRENPVLEAMQLPEVNVPARDWKPMLDWIGNGKIARDKQNDQARGITWSTAMGPMAIAPGDWVIKTPRGEFYPYPDDKFQAKYAEVTE